MVSLIFKYVPSIFTKCHALPKYRSCATFTRNIRIINTNLKTTPNFGRKICTTNAMFAKMYIDNENSFAHGVMENNDIYRTTLVLTNLDNEQKVIADETFSDLIETDWETKTFVDIVHGFQDMAYYARDNNMKCSFKQFNNISKAIAQNKNEFSDKDVSDILFHLSLFVDEDNINENNFYEIWQAMDITCKARANNWDIDKLLFYADHWYKLKLVRYSDFVNRSLVKIGRKIKRLTPPQLIQTMFYLNLSRQSLSTMYDFEKNLHSCLYDLSIEEISLMAMGFFKTKTQIRNPLLLEQIIYRTIDSVDTIHEIALSALAKTIRYSLPIQLNEPLSLLMNNLEDQVPRLSMLCCVHLALLGTNIQMYNPNLIEEIAQKFNQEISTVRLKDIERLAFAFSLYNYDDGDNNIYYNIMNELKKPEREPEISKYPRSFATCLQFLSLRGIYDQDLLNRALSASFISSSYGKGYFNIGREILCLDASIDVELPNYNGNRLNGVQRQKLTKKLTRDIPKRELNGKYHRTQLLLMDVLETVQTLYGGEKYAAGVHILPHYERADILLCLNEHNRPESMIWHKLYETGAVQSIDRINNYKWIVLVPAAKNQLIFGSSQPTGGLLMKLRQLHILGYIPITIPWYEWDDLETTYKSTYLKNKIDSEISENSSNKQDYTVRSF